MNNRKKEFHNILGSFFTIIIFILSEVYFLCRKPRDWFYIIAAFTMICLFIIVLVYGIWNYYKTYILPEKTGFPARYSRMEKQRKIVRQRLKAKDMYTVCKKYQKEYMITRIVLIVILSIFLFGIFGMKLDTDSVPTWIGISVSALLAACFCFFFIRRETFQSVEKMRSTVNRSGYDPQKVNDDFMLGSKHLTLGGLLHIGQDFIVLFGREVCFVRSMGKVTRVSGQMSVRLLPNSLGPNGKITEYIVHIYMNGATLRLKCFNEIGMQVILEEFTKLGIEIDV